MRDIGERHHSAPKSAAGDSSRVSMRRAIHYCVEFHEFLYSRTLIINDASIVRSSHRCALVLRELRGVTSQIACHHSICSCCSDLESRRRFLRHPLYSRSCRVVAHRWRPQIPPIRARLACRQCRCASRYPFHSRRDGKDLAIRPWQLLHDHQLQRRHVAGAAMTS